MMLYIIGILIFIGVVFLIGEIVFLPGTSIAGLLAVGCFATALYIAYQNFGITGTTIVAAIIGVLAIAAAVMSMRYNTWKELSLQSKIESTSSILPKDQDVKIGDTGVTLTRLAPMGRVIINGKDLEAKSMDSFIDQKKDIVVTGFENFNVIVKLK